MKKFFVLAAILAALSSCVSDNVSPGVDKIAVDLNTLDADSVPLSMFADSVSYIELETTAESLIGRISDVKVTDKGILIFDERQKAIFLFERDGRFSGRIGTYGQGPEDLLYVSSIDADSSRIYINDYGNGEVKIYDYNGNYLSKDSIGHFMDVAVISDKSDNPLYLGAVYDADDNSGIYLVEPGENYHATRLLARRDPVDLNHVWEFYRFGDNISVMSSTFEDDLYRLDSDSLIQIVDFTVTPVPSSSDIERWTRSDVQYHYVRTTYLDFPRKFIAYYSHYPDMRIVILDKTDKSVMITGKIYNDFGDGDVFSTRGVYDDMPVFFSESSDEDSNPQLVLLHLK